MFCYGLLHVSWRFSHFLAIKEAVSRSSSEAEYRSMADATCELIWIHNLLTDLHCVPPGPAALYCDNQSALHIASNPVYHERTKHIENDCHLVREKLQSGFLKTLHVQSANQLADVFTKAVQPGLFKSIISKMWDYTICIIHLGGAGVLELNKVRLTCWLNRDWVV